MDEKFGNIYLHVSTLGNCTDLGRLLSGVDVELDEQVAVAWRAVFSPTSM